MSFDAFVDAARADHAEHPQQVADRLADSLTLIRSSADFLAYVQLVTHVYGEHLGRWDEGAALLTTMRAVTSFDGSEALARAIDRGVSVLRYAGGDGEAIATLAQEDRVASLATVCSIFAARAEFDPAIAAYTEAMKSDLAGFAADSPATRALAVGSNNLAAALEDKPHRSPHETAAMLAAAATALACWARAGTWVEQAWAEHRLACSLLQAGQAKNALAPAARCIEICAREQASAYQQFFANAIAAQAHQQEKNDVEFASCREQAMIHFAGLPTEQQQQCKGVVEKLKRSGGRDE